MNESDLEAVIKHSGVGKRTAARLRKSSEILAGGTPAKPTRTGHGSSRLDNTPVPSM